MQIPQATYRIQFNPSFAFHNAQEIISYLFDLGIRDIYASPIFKARKGSKHGYDIVDPNQLNPDLGSWDEFNALIKQLKIFRVGWIQDIVPNHMAFSGENKILMDVFEKGSNSEFYQFFDIDWNHVYESIRGRVLAPFLGKFYAECLEDGELRLSYDESGLSINYYSLRFSLKLQSHKTVFLFRINELEEKLGKDNSDLVKLLGILHSVESEDGKKDNPNYEHVGFAKNMLWELYADNNIIREFIDENIQILNGTKDNPESFNFLDNLLSEQMFRLSFWKVATEEINYRRFFNINDLICMRIEEKKVFVHLHALIFKFIAEGKISGLRIDHIDGLYNPGQYLKNIREEIGDTAYLIIEKVLTNKERMPRDWPVEGTTGYEFLSYTNGLFCQRKNQKKFNRIYAKFSGIRSSFEELACEKKRLIIGKHMAGNIDNLALFMKKGFSHNRHGADITLYGLKRALVEVLSHFPVYRTYISQQDYRDEDRRYILEALRKSKHASPGLFHELNFIEKFLLLDSQKYFQRDQRKKLINFVMNFQQVSSSLMAKGVEDTLFYVYNKFLSLNEVGSNPNKFGTYISDFHNFNKRRLKFWPHSLNTLSTHDTKRGADIRARLNVLSEMPKVWEQNVKKWHKMNRKFKKLVREELAPDKNDEYFLYQTLIGALPFSGEDYADFKDRLRGYLIKAVREAKVHTAWLKPDTDYEDAYIDFMEKILNFSSPGAFLENFLPFQKRVSFYGIFNSLAQELIKITAPGVPDFYQGGELWDLNLVDPDNRRPVDFNRRKLYLQQIREKTQGDISQLVEQLWKTKEDGRIKLFLIFKALQVRNDNISLFQKGSYIPLNAGGKYKEHIIAYARNYEHRWAITVIPRFLSLLINEEEYPFGKQVWQDTYIAAAPCEKNTWQDMITGEKIAAKRTLLVGDILKNFPVALLLNI